MRLEVELGEEPLVLTGLVLFLQSLLHNLLGLLSLGRLVQGVGGDGVLERLNVQRVSGGHQVVVVHQLDEWLDLGSLSNLLGVVSLGHLQWASLDADNDGVWESVGLGAVVVGSDDDNLLTSETTTGNDSYTLVLCLGTCGSFQRTGKHGIGRVMMWRDLRCSSWFWFGKF